MSLPTPRLAPVTTATAPSMPPVAGPSATLGQRPAAHVNALELCPFGGRDAHVGRSSLPRSIRGQSGTAAGTIRPRTEVHESVKSGRHGPAASKEEQMVVVGDRKLEAIRELAETRGIEFFFAQFVDLYGRPSAKLVPAASLEASSPTARASRASPPGRSARFRAIRTSPRCPTSTSLTLVPWQPNLARFACDVTVEGEAWPYCPRTILRRQLARREGARLRVQARPRARVLPSSAAPRTARSKSSTRRTRSRSPATTWPG